MLSDGDKAPDFKLPTDSGEALALAKLKGKPVVLYFYPKDDTSGCTLEAKDFSRLAPDFRKAGVEVIGVSPDSVESHAKFRKKYDLAIRLAADADKAVANGLRRVGREVDVRPQVHGRRALDLPDRQGGPHRQELAQGQGPRPRRRGARRRQGAGQVAALPGCRRFRRTPVARSSSSDTTVPAIRRPERRADVEDRGCRPPSPGTSPARPA